jgi:hypothetical protein
LILLRISVSQQPIVAVTLVMARIAKALGVTPAEMLDSERPSPT